MLKARFSGVIYKGGEVYAYVYNCLYCETEENCDYMGDVLVQENDENKALELCNSKYGGGKQ